MRLFSVVHFIHKGDPKVLSVILLTRLQSDEHLIQSVTTQSEHNIGICVTVARTKKINK